MSADADMAPAFDRQRHLEALAHLADRGGGHPRLQADLAQAARRAAPWLADRPPCPPLPLWPELTLPIDRVAQIPASRIQRAPISMDIAARIARADEPAVTDALRTLGLRLKTGQATSGDLVAVQAALLPGPLSGMRTDTIALRRADESIDFQAPPAQSLEEGMAFLLAQTHRAVAGGDLALLAACYASVNFLHPFADGNGRTSRRLLLAGIGACLDCDLSPLPIDLVVWSNRTYHDYRLRQITQAGQWNGWVAFLLQMLTHALSRLPALVGSIPLGEGRV
ncbi:MAG: Fic family protein [Niveispirillum sp.]|uniref:Fic family protein n=1 Tax=Niveispirillum sp. TaxID=1917217 RepID=UPI003BA5CB3A